MLVSLISTFPSMHCFKIYLQILSQHYKLSLKNAIANYILTSSSALVCRLVWFLNSKSNSKSNNCAPLKGNKSWLLQLIGNVGFHRTPCSRDKVHKIRAMHCTERARILGMQRLSGWARKSLLISNHSSRATGCPVLLCKTLC